MIRLTFTESLKLAINDIFMLFQFIEMQKLDTVY